MDNLNYENLSVINKMYTNISDINTKNNYSNSNHDNSQIINNQNHDINNLYNQNSNQCNNNYQNNYQNNNQPLTMYNPEVNYNNPNVNYNNQNSGYNNLSYLLYEEPKKTSSKKSKSRKTLSNTNNKVNIKLYICMIILFYILNSYYVIRLIDSYSIHYKLSLFIRSCIFITIYYLMTKYLFI